MLPSHLKKYEEPIKVGQLGHVRLVDVMGDDAAIVQAARVSYGAGTKTTSEDVDLINYLIRNHHWSPIEMCEIKFHLKLPMHVARQLVRHRTASLNEVSTRYSVVNDEFEQLLAGDIRLQSKNNKQGSSGLLCEKEDFQHNEDFFSGKDAAGYFEDEASHILNERIYPLYKQMIDCGIAREQARNILPLSTYTEMYWKCDLRNLFNFLKLRLDSHAQQEIRELANAMYQIVKEWVPYASSAFENYVLNSYTLSAQEIKVIQLLFKETDISIEYIKPYFDQVGINSKSERLKFRQKFLGY